MSFNKLALHLSFASLVVLAFGTFTSLSLSAGAHIFALIPGIYFFTKQLKSKKPLPWSAKTLLLLFGVIIISVFVNSDIIDSPFRNILKGKYILFAVLFLVSFRKLFTDYLVDKKIKILLWLFLIATSLASLSGLIGLFHGFNPLKMKEACHATRACGVYGMYMTYGYGISLFMVLLTGALVFKNKFEKYIPDWLLYTAFAINLLGLFFSYARGGWLGYLVAIPFFFIKKKMKMFLGVLGAGVLILGLTIATSSQVREMFLERGASNQARIYFYQAAYKAFQLKPLLGWGYRNFEPNSKAIKEKFDIPEPNHGGHAHNNLMEHLASTGFLGFLLFGFFQIFWLIEMWRRDDWVGDLVLPFVISFCVSGLFQYTFGDGENLFLITGVYALSLIPPGQGEKNAERSSDSI